MTSKITTGLYIHKSTNFWNKNRFFFGKTKILYRVVGTGKTVQLPHINMVIYQQLNMFPANRYDDLPIGLQITTSDDFDDNEKLIKIDE